MSENRQRVSIPIRGLDTSSTDINAADGAMQELHNLRYSGEAWRNVKPFKVVDRCVIANKPFNRITIEQIGASSFKVVAQFPVASDITVTAYWMDIDGENTSRSYATIRTGRIEAQIDMRDEEFGWLEIDTAEDAAYLYYATPGGSAPTSKLLNHEIVYQHPADTEDVYIARSMDEGGLTMSLIRSKIEGGVYKPLSVIAEGLPSDARISHFGKVLILSLPTELKIRYFILADKVYREFVIPEPPVIHQSMDLSTTGSKAGEPCTKIVPMDYTHGNHFNIPLYSVDEGSFMIPSFKASGFWGEICFFAVFQLQGGELLAPGALNISASELFHHSATTYTDITDDGAEVTARMMVPDLVARWDSNQLDVFSDSLGIYNGNAEDGYKFENPMIIPFAFYISPHITIRIPTNIDKEFVRSVQIYATRLNPIWDGEKLKAARERFELTLPGTTTYNVLPRGDIAGCYADNKLPEQPFYLMKDIDIEEFKDGILEMYITADLIADIEHKRSYTAVNAHDIYAEKFMEYNQRVHTVGATNTRFFDGFGMALFEAGSEADKVMYTEINRDSQLYFPNAWSTSILNNPIPTKILSYPDYTASRIYNASQVNQMYAYALTPAEANNFAYAVNRLAKGTEALFGYDKDPLSVYQYVKYDAYFSEVAIQSELPSAAADGRIVAQAGNIMRVSAPNSPFAWPLAHNYAIGTEDNEIIAVNAAALEMSDAKFGEFPLYAFTKEGIFALQSGSGEVLYGAIVPLNYDRIINPHTLAVNYNVLYITSRGVHALHSNESALISEPINDEANRPLLDFLTNAKMAYQHKFGEVIFYNNERANGVFKYPNAYTFSLGAKVWATRDWNAEGDLYTRELLNSGVMIQQGDGFAILSDIHEEDVAGATKCHFLSRPMKFNNQEFKRVETLIARLQADPSMEVHVELQASNNLTTWLPCRDITGSTRFDLNIRRTPFSARYFRVAFDCTAKGDLSFMGFDFEYYMRFLHRMR